MISFRHFMGPFISELFGRERVSILLEVDTKNEATGFRRK